MRWSRVIAVSLLVAASLLLVNCHRIATIAINVPASIGTFDRHVGIAYASHERARLDVYSPQNAKGRAVVIYWHGGLWVEGSRTDYRFVGAALARAGYVAVLPDYRLYPAVRFPAFIEDGASAVRWVHDHIVEYGGDPESIFVAGHSAGAHIAAMIAFDARYLQAKGGSPEWVQGVIGLSGPYAIETGPSPTSVGICAARTGCARLLAAVFAAPHSSNDWQPIPTSTPNLPPTLLLHGAQDAFVSVRHSETLRDRLAGVNGPVELHVYGDADHTDTVLAFSVLSGFGPPVMEDIQRFIDAHNRHENRL